MSSEISESLLSETIIGFAGKSDEMSSLYILAEFNFLCAHI